MKRFKYKLKKGMAFVLSFAMMTGLVPAMSGGANTVQAATGSGTEPSVTAYATKDQLMTAFNPDSDGNATTTGKLVFGKNSSSNPQEWYILGKDSGVSGDNTIIFAASPIATNQMFEDAWNNNKTYDPSYGVYTSNPENVYPNHYGASDLRVALKGMADGSDTSYFTTAEQGLMNDTTVTTKDTKNGGTYTTTDKLYALQGDYDNDQYLWAGTDDSTVLAMSSYWSSGDWFWLRSPYGTNGSSALLANPGDVVYDGHVGIGNAVQPASNLNLLSVLFASAATASSSDTAEAGKIEENVNTGELPAMTLRLDGTGKNIGTVTYNTTTGDIKAVKGSTSQTVALVVQGNDGTNDWYYSKQITGTAVVNTSNIESALGLSDIDLSACKIWLEITDSTENLTYAVNASVAAISEISSVAITDIETPAANTTLDTSASCATTGVSSTTPQITWTPSDTTAGYNTSYTASITLTPDTFYAFANNVTATVLGNSATSVTKNADGTLTVTYAFPATAKDKLTSITAPQPITVANGTAYSAMNLPATVNIVTEGNTVSSAPVTWNTTTPASGSYDPSVLTQQTVTLNGMITCPDSIDDNGIPISTTITITISAAGIVGAPTANPVAGTYTENQSVTLTSSTEGATIYYTTDGSEPTITGGVPVGTTKKYTVPIEVTGTEGKSTNTTIKAFAVKTGMQDSSVQTFEYKINIPMSKYTITATAGDNGTISPSGAVSVVAGGSQTFTISPSSGYEIDTLKVDGQKVTASASYTFSNVNANHTIDVTFKKQAQQSYKIIDGDNSKWVIGEEGSMTICGNGEYSKFVGVKVDGTLLDAGNYTSKEGSTIITLKKEYLDTLTAGTHTFEIMWTDGSATATFVVNEKTPTVNPTPDPTNPTQPDEPDDSDDTDDSSSDSTQVAAPNTGDEAPLMWLLIFAILSGMGMVLTARKDRKNLKILEK